MRKAHLWLIIGFVLALTIALLPPPSMAAKKVSIPFRMSWVPNPEWTAFVVGKEKGFYDEVDIDVDYKSGQGSTASVKLVASGENPIGHADASAILMGVAKNMPVISVLNLTARNTLAFIVHKDSGIKTIKDITGKRFIDAPASLTLYMGMAALRTAGVDPAAVKITTAEPAAQMPLFLEKKADVILGFDWNQGVAIESKGAVINYLYLDEVLDTPSKQLIVNTSYLKDNRDTVKSFMKATIKSFEYMRANYGEAVNIFLKHNPEVQRAQFEKQLKVMDPAVFPEKVKKAGFGKQYPESWETLQNVLVENKLTEKKIEIKEKAYTEKLLEELKK